MHRRDPHSHRGSFPITSHVPQVVLGNECLEKAQWPSAVTIDSAGTLKYRASLTTTTTLLLSSDMFLKSRKATRIGITPAAAAACGTSEQWFRDLRAFRDRVDTTAPSTTTIIPRAHRRRSSSAISGTPPNAKRRDQPDPEQQPGRTTATSRCRAQASVQAGAARVTAVSDYNRNQGESTRRRLRFPGPSRRRSSTFFTGGAGSPLCGPSI